MKIFYGKIDINFFDNDFSEDIGKILFDGGKILVNLNLNAPDMTSNGNYEKRWKIINGDIWLTQNLIAQLFGVGRSTITEHINNILKTGELSEDNTVGKTDVDNSKKPVKIYNLDMIIAVGYRVNSKKATNSW